MGETAEKLLSQHIDEDRIAFSKIESACAKLDAKLDELDRKFTELQTEFRIRSRFAGAALGFLSGIGGAVIVALLT